MEKSPAFQFYPKQWLGDSTIELMDLEAEGAHHRLMCYAWEQQPPCTIPNDDAILRVWCKRLSAKEWARIKPQVLRAWKATDDGRLVNDGLLREWEKQEKRREQAADAGRKSSGRRAMAERPLNNRSTGAEQSSNERSTDVENQSNETATSKTNLVQRNVNPSSSTSSSTSVNSSALASGSEASPQAPSPAKKESEKYDDDFYARPVREIGERRLFECTPDERRAMARLFAFRFANCREASVVERKATAFAKAYLDLCSEPRYSNLTVTEYFVSTKRAWLKTRTPSQVERNLNPAPINDPWIFKTEVQMA